VKASSRLESRECGVRWELVVEPEKSFPSSDMLPVVREEMALELSVCHLALQLQRDHYCNLGWNGRESSIFGAEGGGVAENERWLLQLLRSPRERSVVSVVGCDVVARDSRRPRMGSVLVEKLRQRSWRSWR